MSDKRWSNLTALDPLDVMEAMHLGKAADYLEDASIPSDMCQAMLVSDSIMETAAHIVAALNRLTAAVENAGKK